MDLLHCLINFPEVDTEHPFMLDYRTIEATTQESNNNALQQHMEQFPQQGKQYEKKSLDDGITLVMHRKDATQPP